MTRSTLAQLAEVAEQGRAALDAGDGELFSRLMDRNFELRRAIQTINPANLEMIETARACGASAKFAGSGGSIIGAYRDEDMFRRLEKALNGLGASVIRPSV